MNKKVNVAVIGASGYSGEELLRLLFIHPEVDVKFITSRQYAHQDIASVYPRFSKQAIKFSEPDIEKFFDKVEYCFLALPHGLASKYALPLLEKGIKVIDISADFRLQDDKVFQEYYGFESPRKKLPITPIYGAPERNRQKIKQAQLVACPGCYPTSSVLALYPLLKAQAISEEGIIISSVSGLTGAGRTTSLPFIFSECNDSFRAYNVVKHRHLPEIEQELAIVSKMNTIKVNFIPHLVPMNRGLYSTIIAKKNNHFNEQKLHKVLVEAYKNEPFIRILALDNLADTKNVIWTNFCEIALRYDEKTNNVILTSAIDNLTKGAAGQAVQCFNIMIDVDETTALN